MQFLVIKHPNSDIENKINSKLLSLNKFTEAKPYSAIIKDINFELENASVSTYRLYRDFGAGFQLVQSFAPGDNTFMDNVEEYANQLGTFCYRVEADYTIPIPNEGIASYTTSSNTMCLEQRPSIYVPNAIAPNGINNEFKPVIVFGNPTNYSMKIFNRWGNFISLPDYAQNSNIQVFPNPTNGIVHIEGIANEEISVYDQVGSLVLKAQGKQNIDLYNYENGIYWTSSP